MAFELRTEGSMSYSGEVVREQHSGRGNSMGKDPVAGVSSQTSLLLAASCCIPALVATFSTFHPGVRPFQSIMYLLSKPSVSPLLCVGCLGYRHDSDTVPAHDGQKLTQGEVGEVRASDCESFLLCLALYQGSHLWVPSLSLLYRIRN